MVNVLADSHNILNSWRNHFSQFLNVHGFSDIMQTEIHTLELLVPEPSVFEVDVAIVKLKRYKSPGIDQIPAELIGAGGGKIRSEGTGENFVVGSFMNCTPIICVIK
jgi:hypothetical protein